MADQNQEFKRSDGVIAQRPFHDYITGQKAIEAAPARPRVRLHEEDMENAEQARRQGASGRPKRSFLVPAAHMEE